MTEVSQKLLDSTSVLVPFTRNYADELHASEVSRILKLPQRTVARKLEILQKSNLLNYRRDGRNKYFFLDLKQSLTFSLLELLECYKELDFSLKNPQVSLLLEELAANYSIILFGSYAKGRAKKDSDIDLVIFSNEKKKINEIIKKYHFEVNAHYVNLSLLKKRMKNDWPLAKEIVKDHILFGEKGKIIKAVIDYCKRRS
ncbi:MAG: nucleotidyltransferase domain-containing protein [Nanoarchaeota archaeon]|nr:nucleotidyltransferase domain-containing protein [Nanoarchaeota archaeon]MBU1631920.1 nucleotidyltransferase domain-containing protein [Nanoarchaeota archaeon]MBU1875942.1 nucleotidyltransferase domain-containing protein [Nanoarchaeota archaeon]